MAKPELRFPPSVLEPIAEQPHEEKNQHEDSHVTVLCWDTTNDVPVERPERRRPSSSPIARPKRKISAECGGICTPDREATGEGYHT